MRINARLVIYPIVVALVASILNTVITAIIGVPAVALLSGGGYLSTIGASILAVGLLWMSGFIIIKVVDFFDATRKIKA